MKKWIALFLLALYLFILLTGCSKTKELTPEQIDKVNTAFETLLPAKESDMPNVTSSDGDFILNPISHFFTSYYEKPEDLDMGSFVYYIPRETYLSEKDSAEIEALKASGADLPFEEIQSSPVPFGRIPFSTVNEYLNTYANMSLEAMTNMGDALYSREYGVFYSYASDFDPGAFYCTSGKIKEDTVTLFSEHAVLTLQKNAEYYFIISHLPLG